MCYIAIQYQEYYIFPANKIDTGYYNPESVNRLILYGSHSGGIELIPHLQHLLIILEVYNNTRMKEGEEENETVIEEVKKINNQFYHAFENLSIEMMERLWKHVDNAVCIHPGWDLFIGWLAIRESWITIFRNTEMIRFTITNTKVRVFGGNNIAVVVCLENIETSLNRQEQPIVKIGVVATNIFEYDKNQWLLIHHHGSSVSNYIPPNISPQC